LHAIKKGCETVCRVPKRELGRRAGVGRPGVFLTLRSVPWSRCPDCFPLVIGIFRMPQAVPAAAGAEAIPTQGDVRQGARSLHSPGGTPDARAEEGAAAAVPSEVADPFGNIVLKAAAAAEGEGEGEGRHPDRPGPLG